jgi:hypothetical protein
MLQRVAFSECTFFKNGNAGASTIVGIEGTAHRVVRYKFHTPVEGASKISWLMLEVENYYVAENEKLRFFVGSDPNSHVNAGEDAIYHGTAIATKVGSTYTISGEASGIILLPDTDYYLFIFPGYTSSGYWGWWQYLDGMSVYLDGAAGVVRIKEGARELVAVPMVKEGGQLIQLAATVKSGENLTYCV